MEFARHYGKWAEDTGANTRLCFYLNIHNHKFIIYLQTHLQLKWEVPKCFPCLLWCFVSCAEYISSCVPNIDTTVHAWCPGATMVGSLSATFIVEKQVLWSQDDGRYQDTRQWQYHITIFLCCVLCCVLSACYQSEIP